jgi:hypothetical protein
LTRRAPAHWIEHTGPASHSGPNNWYTVWYPPGWTLEITDGATRLTAPDGGGVLTLVCSWRDASPAVDKVLDLERLFPRRRNVQPLKAADAHEACVGFLGQTAVVENLPWWRRLFRRRRWRNWRVWCLHRGPVYLLSTYLQSTRVDREAETVATMIVNSIRLSDPPACPPEHFARRVLELARRKFPLLDCAPAPDFQIKIGDSKVNLFNFYRSYVNAPDQFESIILPALATVVQVQGWGKEQTEPALDDVRARIMPMLYPEDVWQERLPSFVGMPWVGGLVVLYVVDETHAYWYIRDDLLETWRLPMEELHQIAMENLNRYFDEAPMEFTVAGEDDGPRLLIPHRPDAYNTARLLSAGFHEKLRGVMGGDFAVGTPSRDFFVAVSLDSTETIEHVRRKVEDDFQQMDHPLSDRLLLITHDGVTEYAPWV